MSLDRKSSSPLFSLLYTTMSRAGINIVGGRYLDPPGLLTFRHLKNVFWTLQYLIGFTRTWVQWSNMTMIQTRYATTRRWADYDCSIINSVFEGQHIFQYVLILLQVSQSIRTHTHRSPIRLGCNTEKTQASILFDLAHHLEDSDIICYLGCGL